jgi:1,4-alpha-glucan branching enzyme
MTFAIMYAYSENFVLPISHDEVVHGKGSLLRKIPGSREDQLATVRAFLAYMWSQPGKQLLFMGCEFAQESSGRRAQPRLVAARPAAHYRMHAQVKEMNAIYRANPALWALDHDPAGFRWLNADLDTAGFFPDAPSSAGVVIDADDEGWDGQPYAVNVTVPRLSTVWLIPED